MQVCSRGRIRPCSGALRLASLIAASLLAVAIAASANASVLCVSASGTVPKGLAKKIGCSPTVYMTIGNAVAAAASGDTVFVFGGTYDEMVTIDASLSGLSLLGQNPKTTTIDATGLSNGIFDKASGVTISGFTITDAQHEGILVEGLAPNCVAGPPPSCTPAGPPISNVTIANNIITGNDQLLDKANLTCAGSPDLDQEDCGEGLHLDGVTFSTVANNQVVKNAGGILLTDETNLNGINLVTANDVENNTPDCGITMPSHPPAGSAGNIGLASFGVSGNTVSNNISRGNGAAGVGVFTPTPGTSSRRHVIIGNQILFNSQPGVAFHSHAPGQTLKDTAVIGNVIQGNGADPNPGPGETDGPADSTGIEVYDDLTAQPINALIFGNTIKGEVNDIWVGAPGWDNCGAEPTPCYLPSVYNNNLLGKGTGINNTGDSSAVAVYGPQNWWGCAKGPGAKGCSSAAGNVLTSPFLSKPAK
jgi:hypothetical protein